MCVNMYIYMCVYIYLFIYSVAAIRRLVLSWFLLYVSFEYFFVLSSGVFPWG